jgi:hypothetical protein
MQYEKTIKKILTKLSQNVPIAEIGDILETQKTIFPEASIPREDKNIIIDGMEVTMPLACSRLWKSMLLKEESNLCQIYKEFDRGDILRIKKVLKAEVIVENLSIEEEFRRDFKIDKLEIAKKNFILVRRRSLELSRVLEQIEDTKLI